MYIIVFALVVVGAHSVAKSWAFSHFEGDFGIKKTSCGKLRECGEKRNFHKTLPTLSSLLLVREFARKYRNFNEKCGKK